METKKNPKADLENKKGLFMEIGLAVVLLIVFISFEWSSSEKQEVMDLTGQQQVVEEEIIPITQEQTQTPPEAPKIPVLSDVIDIVDNDVDIADNLFVNTEDDASLGVEIMDYHTEVVEEEVDEKPIPFAFVEEKPKFQGGDANTFALWVNSQLVYPEIAEQNGIRGRHVVTLTFTVNADGTVSNVAILRGVDQYLDAEAIRVVSSSPKWTPGRQREKPVKVSYTFPVVFKLL